MILANPLRIHHIKSTIFWSRSSTPHCIKYQSLIAGAQVSGLPELFYPNNLVATERQWIWLRSWPLSCLILLQGCNFRNLIVTPVLWKSEKYRTSCTNPPPWLAWNVQCTFHYIPVLADFCIQIFSWKLSPGCTQYIFLCTLLDLCVSSQYILLYRS